MAEETQTNPSNKAGRHANRAAAMQFIYMADMNPAADKNAQAADFFSKREHDRQFYSFAEELASGWLEHAVEVDGAIAKAAKNWKIARIAKVDLAILRLAVYEMLFRNDIPPIVSINEAIDLSKEFSGPDSKRFVNGVLDNIKGSLGRPLRTPNM